MDVHVCVGWVGWVGEGAPTSTAAAGAGARVVVTRAPRLGVNDVHRVRAREVRVLLIDAREVGHPRVLGARVREAGEDRDDGPWEGLSLHVGSWAVSLPHAWCGQWDCHTEAVVSEQGIRECAVCLGGSSSFCCRIARGRQPVGGYCSSHFWLAECLDLGGGTMTRRCLCWKGVGVVVIVTVGGCYCHCWGKST
jgi:hypothetical protein